MKQSIVCLFLVFVFIGLLAGCSSTPNPTEVYASIENELSQEEIDFIETLQTHVEKFEVLNQELEMVLDKMKDDDDLEAAIDTMEIAKQEAQYIYNLIELEAEPENIKLRNLQASIQETIESYIQGMNTQLSGITKGEPTKTHEGYQRIQTAKKELEEFLRQIS